MAGPEELRETPEAKLNRLSIFLRQSAEDSTDLLEGFAVNREMTPQAATKLGILFPRMVFGSTELLDLLGQEGVMVTFPETMRPEALEEIAINDIAEQCRSSIEYTLSTGHHIVQDLDPVNIGAMPRSFWEEIATSTNMSVAIIKSDFYRQTDVDLEQEITDVVLVPEHDLSELGPRLKLETDSIWIRFRFREGVIFDGAQWFGLADAKQGEFPRSNWPEFVLTAESQE